MQTKEEVMKLLEEKGEAQVAEQMAGEQINATLELLNGFVEFNPLYRHPLVSVSYAVELMMILVTETLEPEHWVKTMENVSVQLQDAAADAFAASNAPLPNSDQEPDEFAEPANG